MLLPQSLRTVLPVRTISPEDSRSRKLYCFFKKDGTYYQVACKSSLDMSECQFIHRQFGVAVLDRQTENLLYSTKPMEEVYLRFLKSSIRWWKEFYPNV